MSLPANLALPTPSTNAALSPSSTPNSEKAEDVIVTLLNGSSLTGLLVRYIETEPNIILRFNDRIEEKQISLSQIKNFQLANSRHFSSSSSSQDQRNHEKNISASHQVCQLLYTDGEQETIEILGKIEDKNGLHLFVAQAFFNYYHMFVPFSAVKSHDGTNELTPKVLSNTPFSLEEPSQNISPIKKTTSKFSLQIETEKTTPHQNTEPMIETIVSPGELELALKKNENSPNIRLGEALIQENLITSAQLEVALKEQKNNSSTPLGEILVMMEAVTKEDMKKTLARKLGIPFVDMKRFQVDITAIEKVPEDICRRHNLIPLCLYDSKLIIAVENPLYRLPLEDLRFHTKMFVEAVMASPDEIETAINKYYGTQIGDIALALDVDDDEQDDDPIGESDNALVNLVNKMIVDAYEQGASDIHIEPYPGKKKTLVRFRKDGELVPYVELPPSYRNALISRLKVMCDLDISERRKPQDGKINFSKFGPLKIELRVATIPTAGGLEDVVLRVLANGEPIPLDKMGIRPEYLIDIKELINKPYGLFLVCGPTGSGKTTTLHSILGHINTPEKKIWTAEDPVEITQEGLRQVQVNSKIDLTFANAMRAFLRADPDVIMVGEMRDAETTSTGIEASLTGHLVFSTLHTNSATESIVRLLDMGMDPFNFADSLLGILAQRLAKRLCKHCKETHAASDTELNELLEEYGSEVFKNFSPQEKETSKRKILGEWIEKFSDNGPLLIPKSVGCDECGNTGYSGRIALHELLISTAEIKKIIHEHGSVTELGKQAFLQGMVTLKQDGIEKILQGETDLKQVRMVCIK